MTNKIFNQDEYLDSMEKRIKNVLEKEEIKIRDKMINSLFIKSKKLDIKNKYHITRIEKLINIVGIKSKKNFIAVYINDIVELYYDGTIRFPEAKWFKKEFFGDYGKYSLFSYRKVDLNDVFYYMKYNSDKLNESSMEYNRIVEKIKKMIKLRDSFIAKFSKVNINLLKNMSVEQIKDHFKKFKLKLDFI